MNTPSFIGFEFVVFLLVLQNPNSAGLLELGILSSLCFGVIRVLLFSIRFLIRRRSLCSLRRNMNRLMACGRDILMVVGGEWVFFTVISVILWLVYFESIFRIIFPLFSLTIFSPNFSIFLRFVFLHYLFIFQFSFVTSLKTNFRIFPKLILMILFQSIFIYFFKTILCHPFMKSLKLITLMIFLILLISFDFQVTF